MNSAWMTSVIEKTTGTKVNLRLKASSDDMQAESRVKAKC